MQELQLLNNRVDLLLKKYAAMQAENNRLKETVAEQAKSMEGLNEKLAEMEQHLAAVQIGKSVLSDEEKLRMRRQLDNVIGEIDKILTTLND